MALAFSYSEESCSKGKRNQLKPPRLQCLSCLVLAEEHGKTGPREGHDGCLVGLHARKGQGVSKFGIQRSIHFLNHLCNPPPEFQATETRKLEQISGD